MARSYQLKRRAERQDETRQRIVEAAITLHQTKGLVATTMMDVAAEAKVGRATLYRHFPDETALVGACSGQYFERHPLPDPDSWRRVEDPAERLRLGLRETYAYHRETETMMARVLADARDHPVVSPYHEHWQRAAEVLAAAWPAPTRDSKRLNAALALALSFDTWRTVVREHRLAEDQAIALMLKLTCDCPYY